MKACLKCGTELENNRKKYCSDSCKWWYNQIKKDKEKHLPPVKKRNRNYFSMVTGYKRASMKGQGRRSGHMVVGAMAAMVNVTTEEIVEVNTENVNRHFKGITGYIPTGLKLGSGEFIRKENVFKELGIVVENEI